MPYQVLNRECFLKQKILLPQIPVLRRRGRAGRGPGDAIFGIEDFDNQVPRPAARRVIGNGNVQYSVGVGGDNGATLLGRTCAKDVNRITAPENCASVRANEKAKDLFITNPL